MREGTVIAKNNRYEILTDLNIVNIPKSGFWNLVCLYTVCILCTSMYEWMYILSRVRATTDDVWIRNLIYWTL
jgi:hypothetical protein